MSALTLRLPDDKHARLRAARGAGQAERGLALLDKAQGKGR